MEYVIIGNSTAAIAAIEGIRSVTSEGTIHVISKESEFTYARPLISYWLQGKTSLQSMYYRDQDFYTTHGVKLYLGCEAETIDHENKCVKIENGETVAYDQLLVATGSRPFVPPIEGLDTVGKYHTFMSLEDARGLQACLGKNKKVLIIGAGLIGLKCAEAINEQVQHVTVCDVADRILSSILEKEAADQVQGHIEAQGVTFALSHGVHKIERNKATLTNGKVIPFDELVVAVGVRPNVEMLKEIGAKVSRGICIDAKCETSIKGIYAAGDCVESYDITKNQNCILALLPNAYFQGECAGINMAGGSQTYEKAMPLNAIGFFGLHMVTAGSYEGETAVMTQGEDYKKLYYKDDQLKGMVMIGDVKRSGIYTYLIREQIKLSEVDFETIKASPQLIGFSKSYRERVLGGKL